MLNKDFAGLGPSLGLFVVDLSKCISGGFWSKSSEMSSWTAFLRLCFTMVINGSQNPHCLKLTEKSSVLQHHPQ